mgnify:CR=1 FL=1
MCFQAEALNREALFTDETENFRFPTEPLEGDDVYLRFRSARDNVDYVYYIEDGSRKEAVMEKSDSDGLRNPAFKPLKLKNSSALLHDIGPHILHDLNQFRPPYGL